MAIKYTNTKGAVIEFDTVEEFQAFVKAYKSEDANAEVDMGNLPIGTLVKVVDNSSGHPFDTGEELKITEVDAIDGLSPYRLGDRFGGWIAVDEIEFVSFPEEEESTSGNEEDPDLGFKNGDYAKVLKSNVIFNDGDVIRILDAEGDGHPLAEREDGVDGYAMASQLMKIDKPSGDEGMAVDEDDSEIKAGDIVIATEDGSDITEGDEYEVHEGESGSQYFIDDDGDMRSVRYHKSRLRKKPAKRGFKKGDIVYVKEEITDNSGDSIRHGVLTEFIEAEINRGVRNTDGRAVVVEDGELDKLTLVCRAEDRLDK